MDRSQRCLGPLGVVIVSPKPGKAKDHRSVGGVPNAGECERAVQAGPQTGNRERQGAQVVEKPRCGDHRTNGVRR